MIHSRLLVVAVVLLAAASARAQDAAPLALDVFEREHVQSLRFELHVMEGLTAGGAVSTAVGIGLMTTDRDDQAWRIAGGITAGFGVVNVALGALGIWQAKRAKRMFLASHASRTTDAGLLRAKLDDLHKVQKDTVLFAINLGLDVGYVLAGAAAIIASQLHADHDTRWLGGGIASCVQGVFNTTLDLALVLNANRRHRQLLGSLIPSAAVIPTSQGVSAQLGLSGRF